MDRKTLELLASEGKQVDKAEEKKATFKEEFVAQIVHEQQRIEIERLKEEVESLKQDRKQRKYLSYFLFGFMCLYMVAAVAATYLCGDDNVS